jgi:hypothetical protein
MNIFVDKKLRQDVEELAHRINDLNARVIGKPISEHVYNDYIARNCLVNKIASLERENRKMKALLSEVIDYVYKE